MSRVPLASVVGVRRTRRIAPTTATTPQRGQAISRVNSHPSPNHGDCVSGGVSVAVLTGLVFVVTKFCIGGGGPPELPLPVFPPTLPPPPPTGPPLLPPLQPLGSGQATRCPVGSLQVSGLPPT